MVVLPLSSTNPELASWKATLFLCLSTAAAVAADSPPQEVAPQQLSSPPSVGAFPGNSFFTLADGKTHVKASDLKIGDEVLSADSSGKIFASYVRSRKKSLRYVFSFLTFVIAHGKLLKKNQIEGPL